MNILRYCLSSWFTLSVCLSVWGWNAIDILLSISNILFNSHINSATNCSSLSNIMLLGRSCNFYTLFLNNCVNSSTNVFSVIGIKYTILVNQSITTRIESYPCAKGSLIMKSTDICIQGFVGVEFGINLPTSSSVHFLFLW